MECARTPPQTLLGPFVCGPAQCTRSWYPGCGALRCPRSVARPCRPEVSVGYSRLLLLNADYDALETSRDLAQGVSARLGERRPRSSEYDHTMQSAPSVVLRGAVGHQAAVPHPGGARPRVRLSRREVFSTRWSPLPVLRRAGPQADPRPRRAAPSRRVPTAGTTWWPPQRLQRSQGRSGSRRRPACACARRPASRSRDAYSMYSPYLDDPRNEAWRDYLTLNR